MKNPFDEGYFTTKELRKMGFKKVGEEVRIARNSTIIGLKNISFGNRVRIDAYTNLICETGEIVFGSNIHIGAGSYIGGLGGVEFGDFSGCSQGVRIYSATDDFSGESLTNPTIPIAYRKVKRGKVLVDKHVIIGSGSVILPGNTLGEGSAVGALSLVNQNLSPWFIYAGAPVRKLHERSQNLNLEQIKYAQAIEKQIDL